MTEQEIKDLKLRLTQELDSRMSMFIGKPANASMVFAAKSCIEQVFKDLIKTQRLDPVLELFDWDIQFSGNTLHYQMRPKYDLEDKDWRKAVNFMHNQSD
jgi:hypothetical protein